MQGGAAVNWKSPAGAWLLKLPITVSQRWTRSWIWTQIFGPASGLRPGEVLSPLSSNLVVEEPPWPASPSLKILAIDKEEGMLIGSGTGFGLLDLSLASSPTNLSFGIGFLGLIVKHQNMCLTQEWVFVVYSILTLI